MFASQVGSLREEITALTLNASAARGDEVLLVLHSGGGTVTGYGLAAAQLDRIKRAGLKLTVCVDEVAASGGYMMASVADEIVAAPFAIIGSIGVVTVQPNFRSLLDKVGIEVNDVTAGKWKRTMVPYRDPTPEDRAKVQEDLNACLTEFKAHIKHHRPVVDIDEVATGETWSGREALSKRLIDSVGTSDDVLLAALKSNKDVYSVQYQKQKRHQIFGNWVPAGDKETIAGLENAVASVVMDALTRAASAYVGRGPDI